MSFNLINLPALTFESEESLTEFINFTSKYDDILFELCKICRSFAVEVFDFSDFEIFDVIGE